MDEKTKKLKKMATWTIAIFAAVFALTVAILWLMLYPMNTSSMGTLGQVFGSGWPVMAADAVLCLVAYFGYKLYLDKKK